MAGERGATPLHGKTILPLRGKNYPGKRDKDATKLPGKYDDNTKNTPKNKDINKIPHHHNYK